jgi:uncharacterized protein YhdP
MTDLKGEAREVGLAEAQAVLAMARDDAMRARLAELVAAIDAGSVDGDPEQLLEQILELGLQAGRIRAHYGPGGEQAALSTLRRLPNGRARTESAQHVTEALRALDGTTLERVAITAVAPGSYTLSITADGFEASVRLDPVGARLVSLAT